MSIIKFLLCRGMWCLSWGMVFVLSDSRWWTGQPLGVNPRPRTWHCHWSSNSDTLRTVLETTGNDGRLHYLIRELIWVPHDKVCFPLDWRIFLACLLNDRPLFQLTKAGKRNSLWRVMYHSVCCHLRYQCTSYSGLYSLHLVCSYTIPFLEFKQQPGNEIYAHSRWISSLIVNFGLIHQFILKPTIICMCSLVYNFSLIPFEL